MALLDTNVLVHASYRGSPLHAAAAQLVDRGLRENRAFCISPQVLVEFAAVATRKRFVNPPLSGDEVLKKTDLLYRSRRLVKLYPARGTVMRAIRAGVALGVTGPRWYDLFLAVTMREAGVTTIVTEDFTHFSGFGFLNVLHIQEASEQELDA